MQDRLPLADALIERLDERAEKVFHRSPCAGFDFHRHGHTGRELNVFVFYLHGRSRHTDTRGIHQPGLLLHNGIIGYADHPAFDCAVNGKREGVNPELIDIRGRFWTSLGLSGPILALMVSEMLPGQPLQETVSGKVFVWLQFIVATPMVLWAGWPLVLRA